MFGSCHWNNVEVWMMIIEQRWWWFRVFATSMGYEWWSCNNNNDDDHERNGDNEDFLQEISGVRSRTLCRAPPPRVKRILDDDQHIRMMISILGWSSGSSISSLVLLMMKDDCQHHSGMMISVLYYDHQKTDQGHRPCMIMIRIPVWWWSASS